MRGWLWKLIDRWLHGPVKKPTRVGVDENTPVEPIVRPIEWSEADTPAETPRAKKKMKNGRKPKNP